MVPNDDDRRSGKDRRGEDRRKSDENRRGGANRRGETRIKKRLPCEFVDGDKRVRGFVLDVSPKGLFVQTLKPIDLGGEIDVIFTLPESSQTIEIRACVVRSQRVPRHLATVATAGVGLQINVAPPEYFDFIASLSRLDETPPTAAKVATAAEQSEKAKPKPRKRKLPPRMPKPMPKIEAHYRVQAKEPVGSRSRSLIISATSSEHAESQAIEQVGSDWKIVKVERV